LLQYLGLIKDLKKPKTQMSMASFAHSQASLDAASTQLCRWFYEARGSVALTQIEHPAFVEFCNTLGLKPPSRKTLAHSRLDAAYQRCQDELKDKLRSSKCLQAGSDGWKMKTAVNGAPILTYTLNFPTGSVFYGAETTEGQPKTGDFLAKRMKNKMLKICGVTVAEFEDELFDHKRLHKFLGWVLDAASNNRSAMSMLQTVCE
jgi:hypothetical protein